MGFLRFLFIRYSKGVRKVFEGCSVKVRELGMIFLLFSVVQKAKYTTFVVYLKNSYYLCNA